jgi:hypothetical protein
LPGELNFYRELARQAQADGGSVLEIACGTGLRCCLHCAAPEPAVLSQAGTREPDRLRKGAEAITRA